MPLLRLTGKNSASQYDVKWGLNKGERDGKGEIGTSFNSKVTFYICICLFFSGSRVSWELVRGLEYGDLHQNLFCGLAAFFEL